MKTICFYFQVHQPFRLRTYRFFDMGVDHNYFDEYQNRYLAQRIAERCYFPMNELLLKLINKHGDDFKITFSISGMALEQFQKYVPNLIESFQNLAKTGNVEFLAETYSHSLASIMDKDEFELQVERHSKKIEELFGQKPKVFRNTELIYSDDISESVAKMGFNGMLTEGAKHVLGWRSPNFVYKSATNDNLKILLRNFNLSNDISFRFSNRNWSQWPITAEKYTKWINELPEDAQTVNIFMDYETFGEHQVAETGIFNFFEALPENILKSGDYKFATVSEVFEKFEPVASIHVPWPMSWADEERDITAWRGNELQEDAFEKLYSLKDKIKKIDDPAIKRDWDYLQTSDHFYYMCTKWFSDGEIHKYFNPYGSPYDAYINYMNVLSDFILRVEKAVK
ncbi:MAG: polysaccharide deacetylase family protein [Bacteroidales bacterium]|nr:polysaccharide deacetylase family protein [Bacteroidales bacterium]